MADLTCSFCGSTFAADAAFCPKCGTRNQKLPTFVPTPIAGATTPRSRANLTIVICACVAILVIAALAYWQFVMAPAVTLTASVPSEPAANPPVSPPSTPAPVVEASAPSAASSPAAPSAAVVDAPASAKPAVEPAPRPAREKPARPAAQKPAKSERPATTARATNGAGAEPSMTTPAPMPETARPLIEERPKPETRVVQAPPAADRWSEMARELAACEEKNALGKVFCVDRVRWRYCPDYWNKVPQCTVTSVR
jgi:hypothetical protein